MCAPHDSAIEPAPTSDPYPPIGRFVGISREALADWAVDANEVELLNTMLEGEMQRGRE